MVLHRPKQQYSLPGSLCDACLDGSYNMPANVPDTARAATGASLYWVTRRIAIRACLGSPIPLARLSSRCKNVVTT